MYCDCAQRGSYDVFPAASLTVQTPPPSYMAATHVPLQAAQSPTYAANTSSNQVKYSCNNIFTTPVGVAPWKIHQFIAKATTHSYGQFSSQFDSCTFSGSGRNILYSKLRSVYVIFIQDSCYNCFTASGKWQGSLLFLVETQFNWLCLALKFRMSLSKIFNECLWPIKSMNSQ